MHRALAVHGVERFGRGLEGSAMFSAWLAALLRTSKLTASQCCLGIAGRSKKLAPRGRCVWRLGRSLWAHGTRGSVRGGAFLVFLGVGLVPRRLGNLDPPPIGP